jgi:hypothetical protein
MGIRKASAAVWIFDQVFFRAVKRFRYMGFYVPAFEKALTFFGSAIQNYANLCLGLKTLLRPLFK